MSKPMSAVHLRHFAPPLGLTFRILVLGLGV